MSYTLYIIFIKPLDNLVSLAMRACACSIPFAVRLRQNLGLVFLSYHLHEFFLKVSGKNRYAADTVKEQFLNDHIAYLL